MLHDVEPVEHPLLFGIRHIAQAAIDESRPHVEADRLDPGAALGAESVQLA